MKVMISNSHARGEIVAPTSKSETHRALICASLSTGKTLIKNITLNDDIKRTIKALIIFGVDIKKKDRNLIVSSSILTSPSFKKIKIDCGDSGTTARLVTGMSSLINCETTIDGNKRLRKRPMQELIKALRRLGVIITEKNKKGQLPLIVKGGQISGGSLDIDASLSSQFASSILLISPFANKETKITVKNVHSAPYIDLTLETMRQFGIQIYSKKNLCIIKANQQYKSQNIVLSGDYSSASYFFAAAALTEGKVKVNNLEKKSPQGDKIFLEILKEMGCKVTIGRNSATVENIGKLKGLSINMGDYPDLVPTLCILAGNTNSPISITNIGHLQEKESDRINSVFINLIKMGLTVKKTADSIKISPGDLKGASINAFSDHRIAMSFAVAGLKAKGTTQIDNFETVNKSYPQFLKDFKDIGAQIQIS